MTKKLRWRVVALILAIAITGCEQGPSRPAAHASDPPPEALPLSKVDVAISVESGFLAKQITKQLPSPIAQGKQSFNLPISVVTLTPTKFLVDVPRAIVRSRIERVPVRVQVGVSLLLGVPIFETRMVDRTVTWTENVVDHVEQLVDKPVNSVIKHNVDLEYWIGLVSLGLSAGDPGKINITADFDFKIKADVDATLLGQKVSVNGITYAGYDEPMPRVEVTVPVSIQLEDGGKIKITRDNWNLKWLRPCNLTALNISAESIMDLPFVKDNIKSSVDSALDKLPREFDVNAPLDQAWNIASSPIKLVDSVWLVLNPNAFDVGQFAVFKNPTGSFLQVQASLTSRPKVVMGSQPSALIASRPPLKVASEANSFDLNLRGVLSLDEMEKKINNFFQTNPIEHLTVSQIKLFGVDNELFVELHFAKPIRAKVFLRGHPKYDVQPDELAVDDLDFTIESEHFLLEAAVDILHGPLKGALAESIRSSSKGHFSKITNSVSNLNRTINSDASITGTLDKLSVLGIYVTQTDVVVDANAEGNVQLHLGSSRPQSPH
jgi:hypothetical protein